MPGNHVNKDLFSDKSCIQRIFVGFSGNVSHMTK